MTNKKKIAASIGAVGMAAVIALGGTFAWQSINQQALNEAMDTVNPGGRLHDDFNGRNKDVYVENFTEDGTAIFARVRLDEYMEIGQGAGSEGDDNQADPVVADTDLTDKTTWVTRLPGENDTFGVYWDWNMGGQTVYMPTFNMNKDSLKADINGTYDGTSPDDDLHYDDYQEYAVGDTVTGDEVYDADTNDIDEESPVEGTNITTIPDQEHEAALTGTATVITMQEWIEDYDMAPGAYWVWDTDGWAYWAQPIESGETTGLLLDEIIHSNPPSDSWYYGINVVGQFVTADDIGFLNGTGFYDEEAGTLPTAAAELLLEAITGTDIPNTTVTVTAAVADKEGVPVDDASVTWSVSGQAEDDTSINASTGLLTVSPSEAADTVLTVTATYTADGLPYTDTYTVTVTAADAP
ncbi:MAG TPA: hypothetical protein H9684_00540 [Firmicutes bacterium]|nr:hypothetical protein [Bacillota bacterium]